MYIVTTVGIKDNRLERWRAVAMYDNYEDAHQCIMDNWGDIFEHNYYQYAFVALVSRGLYPAMNEIQWFRIKYEDWENNKYTIMTDERPDCLDDVLIAPIG